MSSANKCICECMFSGKSLMYRENNKEPTTEPRGTPELTGISDGRSSSSTTV